jgi:HlyD family secretion protein
MVKSNQVLAEIDPSTYQVAVMRAEAQLSNAVANQALSQVEAGRADTLFASKLIAGADHDTAKAQLLQAQANVKSAEAGLESAQVDLSRCTIYAPVDGVVISRSVDAGQTVAASFNTPKLFVIANDLSKMQIDALISEADIGSMTMGLNVNFTVDAYPYRTFRGKVSQIRYGPITNQNVVCYDAIIEVSNEDLKLLPGMTANVSVVIAERENAVKIPNAALRFRPPEGALPQSNTNSVSQNKADSGPAARGGGGERGGGGRRQGGRDPSADGSRGPGGAGRAGAEARPDRPTTRTVYVLDSTKNADNPELKPVKIKTGINDGVDTEVIEGLQEGEAVVIGVVQKETASQPANPFGGGGRRRF